MKGVAHAGWRRRRNGSARPTLRAGGAQWAQFRRPVGEKALDTPFFSISTVAQGSNCLRRPLKGCRSAAAEGTHSIA